MKTETERLMPAHVETEKCVLGAIIFKQELYDQAAELMPGDFSLDSHRKIFYRMQELVAGKMPIDFNFLCDLLGKNRELEIVGGVAYVTSLPDGVPHMKDITPWVRKLKDKSLMRQFIHTANSAMDSGYAQEESARSTIARTIESLLKLQSGDASLVSARDVADEVRAQLKQQFDNPNSLQRYFFGLPLLNQMTGGLLPEELAILIGRTAGGKSALLNQIIAANASKERPVLFFTLELSRRVQMKRLVCHLADVSNDVLIKGRSEPMESERIKIEIALQQIADWPLTFDDADKNGITISELIARARRAARYDGVGMVCIDYIQKVKAPYKTQIDRMTCVSEEIRMLAKDEKIRVLALSQAGRPEQKNENKRLTMFDPKESGSIENDAHLLMGIQLPKDENGQRTRQDEILILKQRDGELGSVPVEFFGETYTFKPRFWEAKS